GATGDYTINVTGGGGQAPAANDACSARIPITVGNHLFSTVDTTSDGPVHASCSFVGDTLVGNDIWYTFTAPATGTLTVAACGANFDSRLAIYNASGCTNFEARLLGCSENSCGDDASVSIPVTSGVNYTIRLGGANGASGSGTLAVSLNVPPTCAWQNDNCFADFNNDGGIDGDDVIGFFGAWDSNNACGDVNRDNGVDGDDVISFFSMWDAGGVGTPGC
ncbi:MAG: hypothetical protein ACOYN0_11575, partial [Phycisphaerales bacterium]